MLRLSMPSAAPFPALVALLLACVLVATPGAARDKKKQPKDDETRLLAQVTSDKGEVIDKASVTVSNADGTVVAEGATDRKGELQLDFAAPSGTYAVSIEAEGWAPFDAELAFEPGTAQEVTFRLLDEEAGRRSAAVEQYNAGVEAHQAQDFASAKERFREAITIDPTLPQAHLGLADVLLQMEEYEAAIEEIETFRELAPEEEAGARMAYEIYRRAGRSDEAQALAEELGEESLTKDVAVHAYNQGAVATQKGEWAEALQHFDKAVSIDPELEPAWVGIASAAYNVNQVERTLEAANQLLALDPQSESGLRFRFLALDTQRAPDALAAWDAYYAVQSDDASSLLHKRADLDFRSGRNESAITALKTLLGKEPDNPRAHYLIGLIYSQSDPTQAKTHLQRFIDLAPDDPEVGAAREILAYL
ncbi:MAG: tetratricopeptide repeat protein [Acidobacteriota bacterium]